MKKRKERMIDIVSFALMLSGVIILIILAIFIIAEVFLRDPLILCANESNYSPSWPLVKMLCYITFILVFFIFLPLKRKAPEKSFSKKEEIVTVILLSYLITTIFLAFFLSLATDMVDYAAIQEKNTERENLLARGIPCSFDVKESFFDAVSGFTTTGLTALKSIDAYHDGVKTEISKIDVQPNLIHIVRATYMYVGGIVIILFYLYFTPVPSLMLSMRYEAPFKKTFSKFIKLEGLSLLFVYVIITSIGILLLFFSIGNACQSEISGYETSVDNETILTYSVILTFSSVSTGGFSPESVPLDQIQVGNCRLINHWSLLIIMGLMIAGAMPLFIWYRPLKFLRRWKILAVFLLLIFPATITSYSRGNAEVLLYRTFDVVSAFSTTGLSTSQFVEDFEILSKSENSNEQENEIYQRIHRSKLQGIYMIALMFIGGAPYSTAGGWGLFNFMSICFVLYLFISGKFGRVLPRFALAPILSYLFFFSIFAVGTLLCYESGLFSTFPYSLDRKADQVLNSAFCEISALSTVGLMPSHAVSGADIYSNNLAYLTLLLSMLVGRVFDIIFPLLILSTFSRVGSVKGDMNFLGMHKRAVEKFY
jgi:Trk-type K+ transport system membrane component